MRALLAIDGSPSAQTAVNLVASLRWPIGSSVRIVCAVEAPADSFVAPGPAVALPEPIDLGIVSEALQVLDEAAAQLRDVGLRVETSVLRGRPADEIVDDIQAHLPDVVFVGNRGHSAFDRMLLGSVSSELVDRSRVPVLVARRGQIERVVIAVDGSTIATDAVAAIRYWPFVTAAEITVLSVAPEPVGVFIGLVPGPGDEMIGAHEFARSRVLAQYRGYADEAADALRSVGLDAHAEVRIGAPADGIVAFADAYDADLIITGSHGRTGISRLVLGSVARNVLHHARCSVLIVKRHASAVPVGEPAIVGPAWTIATH